MDLSCTVFLVGSFFDPLLKGAREIRKTYGVHKVEDLSIMYASRQHQTTHKDKSNLGMRGPNVIRYVFLKDQNCI